MEVTVMDTATQGAQAVAADAPSETLSAEEKKRLAALENRVEKGLQVFREIGAALMEIRDSRLYRETHSSFEKYCQERWGIERQRAYQLIGAVEVIRLVGDTGAQGAIRNEATARELVAVMHSSPDDAKRVFEAAKDAAGDKPITAQTIRTVRGQVLEPVTPATPAIVVSVTDKVLDAIERLGTLWREWKDSEPDEGDRKAVQRALAGFKRITSG